MKTSPALVAQHAFTIETPGRRLIEITGHVRRHARESGMNAGVAHVFAHHTSCSLLVTENADPDVLADLERYFSRLVPDGDPLYAHDAEGPDDMPAHVRAALTAASVTLPLAGGDLALGTWQGVYLWEHRRRPHRRRITVTLVGC
ncbi:secondary thiamine-phosphate synthase enzyme YjbQ [Pigmentiphaga sp. GD03639]|uniref:Secondary thiamine-phosphate synthase enzyme YjbQ n=1 Tax=Pigmentiphaga daeguensis TaxID=414049 RepID=A0ABP3LX13_9BURK|nr:MULTISPECIES: secondary thiamine-phosphate synthase enzyme YjbQ [unclassified Pigmentiphaga]MDH2236134.1 secondary thiamine-phosphate synthase enzyme YjbQ [Pigmentiphaga sp. GD03639]OVZ58170.1 secondary thiamine-phosphate synthase [Pigmentiphaga sp. NML030171]